MKTSTYKVVPRLYQSGKKIRKAIAVLYLEDMEKVGKTYWDFCSFIDHKHIPAVLSPIHDMDHFTSEDVFDWCTRHLDPETGDLDTQYLDEAPYVGKPKKKHVHLGIMVPSQMDAYQLSELFSDFMYVRPSVWEQMISYRSFVRYLAHLDSPEKARYSPFDVRAFGGADLSDLLSDDKMEKINTLIDINSLIHEKKYRYFHQLLDGVSESGDIDAINLVYGRASVFFNYFSSQRMERQDRAAAEEAKRREAKEKRQNKGSNN